MGFESLRRSHSSYGDVLVPVAGHFAERHFAERHLAERHFAERTFCRRTLSRTDILSNGQYDERTFRRKDILPKRQLAENREILGIVTHFGEMSFRRKVRSSYCPFDKMSVRLSVCRQNVRSAKSLSAKCLSAKCPGTLVPIVLGKLPQ